VSIVKVEHNLHVSYVVIVIVATGRKRKSNQREMILQL